jgi:CRISPR/Cas system-associated exonuclease Cas4 (RecB family)
MYDYKTGRIIDLKTSHSIKWQCEKGFIPRRSDILQLLCYGSLFQGTVKVSQLTLIYADMKDMLPFGVSIVDMNSWMKERIQELYTSLMIRKGPAPTEPSEACNYCKFKTRCANLEKSLSS